MLISLSSVEPEVVNRLTRELTDAGYHVALSSGLHDIDLVRFRAQDLDGRTLIYVEQIQRGGWRAVAKRTFDIVVSVVALVLTAPISLVAAIAIKRSSPGPVIFAQERVGRDGETFRVFKFRTMVADAEARRAELDAHNEADGPMFKMAGDPRVTKVGACCGKLSIDEIPQFVNVLRGEMSVVGPRPALAVRGRAVDRRRPRPPPRAARDHRHVAGLGALGHDVRRVQAPRPVLRRQLVAGPRSAHRLQDVRRRAGPRGAR